MMEPIVLARTIAGFIMALFLPGFFIVMVFFEEFKPLEKIAYAIALSIGVDIFIGVFLGYNLAMKNLTGGITEYNVWLYSSIITASFFVIFIVKKIVQWLIKRKKISSKNT